MPNDLCRWSDAKDCAAEIAHEANRAYAIASGQEPRPPYAQLSDGQRANAKATVEHVWRGGTAEARYEEWRAGKNDPSIVAYADLPEFRKIADAIFYSVVAAVKGIGGG